MKDLIQFSPARPSSSSPPPCSESSSPSTSPATNPYSVLNEYGQRGVLQSLRYIDLGPTGQHWIAHISAAYNGNNVEATTSASSKALAKKMASGQVLDRVQDMLSYSIPFSRSQTKLERAKSRKAEILEHTRTAARLLSSITDEHNPPFTFLALDLECYERDHRLVTEVGMAWCCSVSLFDPTSSRARHLIISEHSHLRNGQYVPDHMDDFEFGKSDLVSIEDLSGHILATLADVSRGLQVVLVGHSISNDLRWLSNLGIDLDDHFDCILDIGLAYQGSRGLDDVASLEKMLAWSGVSSPNLHNAGNDSMYTLDATRILLSLVSEMLCV